jgi:hypothetical protein
MEAEMVSEMLGFYIQLTQLVAWQEFTKHISTLLEFYKTIPTTENNFTVV